jgi:Glycosyltransferase family 87
MAEWLRKRSGWIALILLAAIYYPLFGKGVRGLTFYVQAGQCILSDQPLIACAPGYSYSPALAVLVIPIGFAPAALQELIWYVICVGSLVITVRLAEAMAGRLYPGATLGRHLIWLRAVTLGFCAKHILDVLNYEAYDAPALAMIMLGVWTLTAGREARSGFWLGAATAVRATPLIFLPYLVVRRRYLAAAVFVVALFALAVLPDLIGALRGGHIEYLRDWVLRVASPALLPGHAEELPFWNSWTGPFLDNQSLRGLVNRFAQGPVSGLSPTLILLAVDAVFALLPAALVLLTPRDSKRAAIDGAVLLIATLALAPMTSRYHFVFVLPAVALIAAAVLNDPRMRVPGSLVLAASFILLTGTSNDLVGRRLTEFAYLYGFMVWGAAVLLVALAIMTWIFPPPGLAAGQPRLPEPAR